MANFIINNRNNKNRSCSELIVDKYAEDMRCGNWVYTGDPIRFDENNILLDGQHRMYALVKSGVNSMIFSVVSKLDRNKTFKNIDKGRKRTIGDDLHTMGVKSSTRVSTLIKNIILFKQGLYGTVDANKIPNSTEVFNFYISDSNNIDTIVSKIESYHKTYGILAPGIAGPLYYFFLLKNKQDADFFMNKFYTGIDLSADSPILAARNKVNKWKYNKNEQKDIVKTMMSAWNKFRSGQNSKNIRNIKSNKISII